LTFRFSRADEDCLPSALPAARLAGGIIKNIEDEQSKIRFFPARLNGKRDWISAAVIPGTPALLRALDSHDDWCFSGFNIVFTEMP
jgi:hypothetical protein